MDYGVFTGADKVSFPGLGIDPFHLNETAFTVFGKPIAWYGIIICAGMIIALMLAFRYAKYEKIKSDDIVDLAIFLIIFGVIGARLYYVIFYGGYRGATFGETLLNIIAVWRGGLGIYGALIAGGITLAVVAKIKKIRISTLLDVVSPGVMAAQAIGRWGNFMNREAFGRETDLPWRMGLHTASSSIFVHPTFLYESLWNVIGVIIILCFYKKKKFNGQVFLFYMGWYGLGRSLVELLRTDSLMLGSLRISHLVGVLTFIAALVLMIVFLKKTKKYNLKTADYSNGQSGNTDLSDSTVTVVPEDEKESECSSETVLKKEMDEKGEQNENN